MDNLENAKVPDTAGRKTRKEEEEHMQLQSVLSFTETQLCAEQFLSMIYVLKETTFKTSTLIVKPNKLYTAPF